ncbi:MAG: hypothetical protein HY549_03750 [Elusimicrobia bacterium]|nr:hypothetical protein [Elusimicrobiota bacterium]
MKKAAAAGLSLLLVVFSWGPATLGVMASAGKASGRRIAPLSSRFSQRFLGSASVDRLARPPRSPGTRRPGLELSDPSLPRSANPSAQRRLAESLAALERETPLDALPADASDSERSQAAESSFLAKMGARISPGGARAVSANPPPSRYPLALLRRAGRTVKAGVWTTAISLMGSPALAATPAATPGWSDPMAYVLAGAAIMAVGFVSVLFLSAAIRYFVYRLILFKGRGITEEQFQAVLKSEIGRDPLMSWVADLVSSSRELRGPVFSMVRNGRIHLRPELASSPYLLRLILVQRFLYSRSIKSRAPMSWRPLELSRWFIAETKARGGVALEMLGFRFLERALRQSQLSLKLDLPFEMLVLNASEKTRDPGIYERLSGGQAQVSYASAADPASELDKPQNAARYQAVVIDQSWTLLSVQEGSKSQLRRIERSLDQLDNLHWTAEGRRAQGQGKALSSPRYQELADEASGSVFQEGLKDLVAIRLIAALYRSLTDEGFAFLPFGSDDPGVEIWEKLFRYWRTQDGGQFSVVRVDYENGGHVLMVRKAEAKEGLLIVLKDAPVAASIPLIRTDEELRQARLALAEAGQAALLGQLDRVGARIEHVWGVDGHAPQSSDDPESEPLIGLYVTVPRSRAGELRDVALRSSAAQGHWSSGRAPPGVDIVAIHNLGPVLEQGISGQGSKIVAVGTGKGHSVESIDITRRGHEDWDGHETWTLSLLKRLAKGAVGAVVKVFPSSGRGAFSGPIMAAGTIGWQRGDTIYLALGSSDQVLSDFFSRLTLKRNPNGQFVTVLASAGNAGFQAPPASPARGRRVFAVGAYSQGSIPHFAVPGPSLDPNYFFPRRYWFPHVVAESGSSERNGSSPGPNSHAIYSGRSPFAPKTLDDSSDGSQTGKVGSSGSVAIAAAIEALVKEALDRKKAIHGFVADNLPVVRNALLMLTARDQALPVWHQGAGLLDGGAAVQWVLSQDWSAHPGWIEDLREIQSLEDRVYRPARHSSPRPVVRFSHVSETALTQAVAPEARDKALAALRRERLDVLPRLLDLMDHKVWLVRRQAALALWNVMAIRQTLPEEQERALSAEESNGLTRAAQALLRRALDDPEPRVSEICFLALAEFPAGPEDALIGLAASSSRLRIGLYAAYAAVRRGNASAIARLKQHATYGEASARFTAVWLAGELGGLADTEMAEILAAQVSDRSGSQELRHLALASLAKIARAAPGSLREGETGRIREIADPGALSDKAIALILSGIDADNPALASDALQFFQTVLSPAVAVRMRREPLRGAVSDFVTGQRLAATRYEVYARLLELLAPAAQIPMASWPGLPQPGGRGVPGVDRALGYLDILVEPPQSPARWPRYWRSYPELSDCGDEQALKALGLDSGWLDRFAARLNAVLPLSGAIWLRVPEHKAHALGSQLESRGYRLKPALAQYPALGLSRASSEKDAIILSQEALPSLPSGPSPILVKISARAPVSEAVSMATMEALYAKQAAHPGRPLIIHSDLFSHPSEAKEQLSNELQDQLMLNGVLVIAPAGDAGPSEESLGNGSRLALLVGASGPVSGLQGYSSRDRDGRVAWSEPVSDSDIDLARHARRVFSRPSSAVDASALALLESLSASTPLLAEVTGELLPGVLASLSPQAREELRQPLWDLARRLMPGPPFVVRVAQQMADWVGALMIEAAPERNLSPPRRFGTGAAAAASAVKLGELAQRLADAFKARGRPLPPEWHLYLLWLAHRALSSPSDPSGPGLFDNLERAMAMLEADLAKPERIERLSSRMMADLKSKQTHRPGTQRRRPWSWRPWRRQPSPSVAVSEALPQSRRSVEEGGRGDPASRPTVSELKQVLGDGAIVLDEGLTGRSSAFSFLERYVARGVGLEGFYYSKRELERELGEEALLGQWDHFFRYLDNLLAPFPWAGNLRRQLSQIQKGSEPLPRRNQRLNALLEETLDELREEALRADESSWDQFHGYMMFARAYGRGPRFFDSVDDEELDRIARATGANALYAIDVFKISPVNLWGTGGGSPFALHSYTVKDEHGGNEAARRFVERAHRKGFKVAFDEIPNHAGLGSEEVELSPQNFIHIPAPEQPKLGEDPEQYKRRILAQVPHATAERYSPAYHLLSTTHYPGHEGKPFWILVHHPLSVYPNYVEMWIDMAQRDFSRAATRQWIIDKLIERHDSLGHDLDRFDMASYLINARYYSHWVAQLEAEIRVSRGKVREEIEKFLNGFKERWKQTGKVEILKEVIAGVRQRRPRLGVFPEGYGRFHELSGIGANSIYNKVGLYDAMVRAAEKGLVDKLEEAIDDLAYRTWQLGGASWTNFAGTFDGGEGNPYDKFGDAARPMIATALLQSHTLINNGLELGTRQADRLIGDLRASGDLAKDIPFDIPVSINWPKIDPENADFFRRVIAVRRARHDFFSRQAVITRLQADAKERKPIVAWTRAYRDPQSGSQKTLLFAVNYGRHESWQRFRFPKPVLASFGAFSLRADRHYVLKELFEQGGQARDHGLRTGAELSEQGIVLGVKAFDLQVFELEEVAPNR